MRYEMKKPEVIEPEVFIPGDGQPFERRAHAAEAAGRALRGAFAFIVGAAVFIIFLTVLAVLALPMLIMALFGKKPNIKIFKYRI